MAKSSVRRGGGGGEALRATGVLLIVVLGILSSVGLDVVRGQLITNSQLSMGFYNVTCPAAEQIVRNTIVAHFQQDATIAAHLLRLQFHDCAATGCDASVLLTGPDSEQEASPNLTLEGFDVINDIKSHLEANCTGIVSCSDILAMAARDAVSLTGGPNFSVPLGRFDSNVSGGSNVSLPSPSFTVDQTIDFFHGIGLSIKEMVVLLGAHTIGAAHCSSFSDRLYNFNNSGLADPSMDPAFLVTMQETCPQTTNASTSNTTVGNTTVALDLNSEFVFDTHYYTEMITRHGVLQIDQEITNDTQTADVVQEMAANATLFSQDFASSLVKMGQIGVKNSTTGVIRLQCSS